MGNALIVRPEESVGWVAPRTFPEVKEMGEWLIKQGILPESVKTGGQAATIIMAGMEIGLRPIESFRHLYVVRGQPSMSTKLMVRLFRRAGHDYEIDEWTKDVVLGRLVLKNGKKYEHALTRAECDEAHWSHDWDKEKKAFVEKHTWKGMGKVMLMYRWLSTGIRAFAPECLDGMVTIDEAGDAITPDDVERDADMIETGAEPQATQPEPEVAEAEYVEAEPEPATEPEPARGWATWSEKAHRGFWAKCRELDLDEVTVHMIFGVGSMTQYEDPQPHAAEVLKAIHYGFEQGLNISHLHEALAVDTLNDMESYEGAVALIDAYINEQQQEPKAAAEQESFL